MHRPRDLRLLQITVACIDAAVIAIVFAAVFVLYPQFQPHDEPLVVGVRRALQIGIYVVGWLGLLAAYRLYEPEYMLDGAQQYGRLMQASTTGLLLLVGIVALVDGSTLLARTWLLSSWILSLAALGLSRFLIRRVVWRLRQRGRFRARMLIIGAGEDGLAIAEQLTNYAPGVACVVGYLDEYRPVGAEVGTSQILGEPLALASIARQTDATDAVIVPQAVSWESIQALLQAGAESWGLQRLWLAPAFRDLLTTGMEVHQHGTLPLLAVSGPRVTGLEAALKRGVDLALAIAAAPIVLPLGVLIAAWLMLIRHTQPLTTRETLGRNRRHFGYICFAAEPELVRWHLWRLPALLNVVRGDLSLVGPRPIDGLLDAQYHPWRVMLTSMRPGLTGPWWLLSGGKHLSVETEVGADLTYVRNYSIWFDLRILVLTAKQLVSARGFRRIAVSAAAPETDAMVSQATAATSGGTQ